MQKADTTALKELRKMYNITQEARYDLNYVNPEKRGYKDRLIRWFYVLQKK